MRSFDRLQAAACCGLLMITLLSACRTVGVEQTTPPDASAPVDQSIVFLIHGDADYLYHGPDGTRNQADERAVAAARRVAERNPDAEVFIFHQRPRKNLLFLFPRDDGTFYHYRGGELIARETYRRETGDRRLRPETAYYESRRADEYMPSTRILVYMGHEIPEASGVRYDASLRDGVFSVDQLARGAARLTGDDGPFDLLVLSTCNGGTPHTIGTLAQYADHIVASPDDLHLSHLDLEPLERLDQQPSADAHRLADELALESFERLTADVQTVVSVAVYNTKRVRAYLDDVAPAYDSLLTTLRDSPPAAQEYVDCAEVEAFARPGMSEGVEILYRPPRFGRGANRTVHSGWQCRRVIDTP